ncbi:MAG: response regulator [Pseudohongiellaceae bacterium]
MHNILLVEDNVTQSLELKQILRQRGYTVGIAYDAKAAIKSLGPDNDIELIISDVVMPGLSGFELCEVIKQNPASAHIPVMLITAYIDTAVLIRCIQSGADAFLTKPLNPDVFTSRVESLLANRQSNLSQTSLLDAEILLGGERVKISAPVSQLLNLLVTTIEDSARSASELDHERHLLAEAKSELELAARRMSGELGEAREQLNLRDRAIESLDVGVMVLEKRGAEFVTTDANTAIHSITGYHPNELIGKPLPIITTNLQTHQEFLEGFEKAGKSQAYNTLLRVIHRDGPQLWCRVSITPIGINVAGSFSFACVFIDITTDKQIQLALSHLAQLSTAGEDYFRDMLCKMNEILQSSIGFITLTDGKGHASTVMIVNNGTVLPNWSYLLKGTPGENLEESGGTYYTSDVVKDFPDVQLFKRYKIRAYAIRQISSSKQADNGFVGIMSSGTFLDPDTVLEVLKVYAIAIAAHLTRLRSDRQYQQLFKYAPDAMLLTDKSGVIQLANEKALNLFGYEAFELAGQSVEILVPDEIASTPWRLRENYYADPAPRTMGSNQSFIKARKKDGSVVPVVINLSSMESDAGLQVVSNIRDITLELQQEEDRAARAVAEQANIAKSSFLATMSHEIRTPINGIIGSVELLTLQNLSSGQHELVRTVMESSKTLLYVIDDILDFSKIEAGKLAIEREPVSLESIAESACIALISLARKKNIKLVLFTDPALPATTLSDPIRLRQIFNNLISNAIKFSFGTGRLGRVIVKVVGHGTDSFSITVTDNGIGMTEAFLKQLFVPFTQEEASTTRRYGGTGLGLTICKHLTELLNGTISVRSKPNEGTSFIAVLPFVQVTASASVEKYPDVKDLDCVLVTVDHDTAENWRSYLEAGNAKVRIATTLKILSSKQVPIKQKSVVLTDLEENHTRDWLQSLPATAKPFVVIIKEQLTFTHPFSQVNGTLLVSLTLPTRREILRAVAIGAEREKIPEQSCGDQQMDDVLEQPSRESALAHKQLILVAEDNEVNQEVIQKQLLTLGYVADIAADGMEALTAWRKGDYALLFSDVHMPIMDGYELTQSIRKESGDLARRPIIALTANAMPSEKKRCLDVGMDDYLSKPVSLDQLRSKLLKWLPRKDSSDTSLSSSSSASPSVAETAKQEDISSMTKPFNPDELAKYAGTDPASLRKHITRFHEILTRDRRAIEEAFAKQETRTAVELAHRIKSSARMMGAGSLADVCEQIEATGRKGKGALDTQQLKTFLDLSTEVLAAVQAYLGGEH